MSSRGVSVTVPFLWRWLEAALGLPSLSVSLSQFAWHLLNEQVPQGEAVPH